MLSLVTRVVSVWNRLRALARREAEHAEMLDEISFHRQQLTRELERRGVAPHAAARSAAIRLGPAAVHSETARDAWRFMSLESLAGDVRFALRQWRRNPVVIAVSIVSIALGVGVNAGIFSLVNAAFLRPLPVPAARDLRLLLSDGETYFPWSLVDRLRKTDTAQIQIAGTSTFPFLSIDDGSGARLTPNGGVLVSDNYFAALRVTPLIGRVFRAGDEDVGPGDHISVLSHRFWQSEFGGDSNIVNRAVRFNGVPFTVVGVAPPEFRGTQAGLAPDAWFPITADDALLHRSGRYRDEKTNWWVQAIGRVAPTAEITGIAWQLSRVVRDFRLELEGSDASAETRAEIANSHLTLEDGQRGFGLLRERYERPLRLIWSLSALVLLIASLNVGGVLVGRITSRRQEFGVRTAIGATWSRLQRQVMIEGALLAGAGGALGLVALYAVGNVARPYVFPAARRFVFDFGVDGRVIAVIGAGLLVTLLALAVLPALVVWRHRGPLGSQQRSDAAPTGRLRLSRTLSSAQFALAVPLVSSAFLLTKSLTQLRDIPLGYDASQVVMVRLDASRNDYSPSRMVAAYRETLAALRALPGISSVSATSYAPLTGSRSSNSFQIEGEPRESANVQVMYVDPEYFKTMGAPLVAGREFAATDAPRQRGVIVVGESFAVRHFGSSDAAVGKRLARRSEGTGPYDIEIVGVAPDARLMSPREPSRDAVYQPFLADSGNVRGAYLLVRTSINPQAIGPSLRRAIALVDPQLEVLDVRPFRDQISANLTAERMVVRLTLLFGGLALLLAALGVYGVASHDVTQRSHEIGVRLALGATPRGIGAWVVRGSSRLVAVGVILGLPLAAVAAKAARALLFDVAPSDPLGIIGVTLTLTAVLFVATWAPARRASRVDPLRTIRGD